MRIIFTGSYSSVRFELVLNRFSISEISKNRELNLFRTERTRTELNRIFGSVQPVLVLWISSELNFGNTMELEETDDEKKCVHRSMRSQKVTRLRRLLSLTVSQTCLVFLQLSCLSSSLVRTW